MPDISVGVGQLRDPSREYLRFLTQLGVEDVIFNFAGDPDPGSIPLSTEPPWGVQELVQLRNRVEDAGLRLEAIENLPRPWYEDAMLGREGADEQLEAVTETVRNLGRAGIDTLGYNWMPNLVWRTSRTRPVRGGAEATAYDHAQVADAPPTHGREYAEAELWENYERFLREVVPVAEEAGVTLCAHPDDPPVESLGGVPRLLRNPDGFRRAQAVADSPNHGLEFCLGTFSEMGLERPLPEVIREFGDAITYVHFRDVSGSVPAFHETFVDLGNYDERAVLAALAEVGFDGVIIPDHVPRLEGDPESRAGRGFTVGYLRGMLAAMT